MTLKEQLVKEIEAFKALYEDRVELIEKLKNGELVPNNPIKREEAIANAKAQLELAIERIRQAREALVNIQR